MFNLKIKTDNAAFDDGYDGRNELARILRQVAGELEDGNLVPMTLRDSNGNAVGTAELD